MKDPAKAKKIRFERTAALFRQRPNSAVSINELTVRVRYGRADEIEGCGCKLVGNTFRMLDGDGQTLRPGFLGLATLGLCLAHGYMARFAINDIPVKGVEVSLKATIDKRKAFGVSDDAPAGYKSMQYHVEVDSDDDGDRILDILDDADSHSPWLYNFTQPLPVEREVSIRKRKIKAAK